MKCAKIATEIRGHAFFRSLKEDLLLELCAMFHERRFASGEVLIKEGQKNSSLFFLRNGTAEVSQKNVVLYVGSEPGEVFGEMSAIHSSHSRTSVKTTSDCDFFEIRSDEIAKLVGQKKDQILSVLFHEYCKFLDEQIEKEKFKGPFLQILEKDLYDTQKGFKAGNAFQVLLYEPDKNQQLPISLALGGSGVELDIATDHKAARTYLDQKKYDLVLSSEAGVDLLKMVQDKKLARHAVLIGNKSILGNLKVLEQNRFINSIISRDVTDSFGTIRYVLTSLRKLLNNDFFGIDKYLRWGSAVQKRVVKSSSQRQNLCNEMEAYFKKMGVRSSIVERACRVTEEMLMNAIYDAPVGSDGKSLFNHLSRKNEIHLEENQQSSLSYATDGGLVVVSVADPFGALTKEVIVDYLLSCYRGKGGSLNGKKGGGGWGLHQTIENSDLTVFTVKKGVCCEVVCLFNTDGHHREQSPTFHYFFTE